MIIDESSRTPSSPPFSRPPSDSSSNAGVASTTIRDIAKEAKVAEGTLYRHYDSKEKLASDILQKNLATFTEFMDRKAFEKKDLSSRLRGLAEAFTEAYEDNQDVARFVLFSPRQRTRTPSKGHAATPPRDSGRPQGRDRVG